MEVPHAVGAADRILYIGGDVIRQVLPGHATIRRDKRHHHHKVGGGLGDADPLLLYLQRQQRLCQRQLVLHLYLSGIGIGALRKGQRNAHAAVGITFGGNVLQIVETVHLLFNHLHHRILHRLRRGTGIVDLNADGGWRDAWVLRHRQIGNRQQATQHHDDGQHPGKHRALDKEFSHAPAPYACCLTALWQPEPTPPH
ncbi:hypothetical protein D3C80_632760 [compost metagenome]